MCGTRGRGQPGSARWPLCNGRPDTAISLLGLSSPLCARCTGIVLGCLSGAAALTTGAVPSIPLAITILACLPALIDGLQSYYGRGTTNPRRLLTGTLLGLSLALFLR